MHDLGLREIEQIDEAFSDLGARVLRVHGLEATLAALHEDPALHFGGADEIFDLAVRTLARAEAAVPRWFGRVPGVPCEVLPIPAESAPHQTLAYYAWPDLDGSRPGRYHVNLHAPETRARYEAEALAFHEAVPGHHLQMTLAAELRDLPAFQRMLGSNAFVEGWALYAERLADEMGLYSSDLDRFGILSFDAWRASRLVVDTGIHALGWTRDEAIAFMREHTALDDREHRQRGRPIHWLARPGACLQARPARDPAAPGGGGGRPRAALRHPRLPRRGPGFRGRRLGDARRIVDAWIARHEALAHAVAPGS